MTKNTRACAAGEFPADGSRSAEGGALATARPVAAGRAGAPLGEHDQKDGRQPEPEPRQQQQQQQQPVRRRVGL